MIRRLVDLLLSAAILLLSSPLLIVLALLIRRDSHGRAIFRQTRMGRNFKTFQILKLRTMREMPGSTYTLGDDARITPLGHWLRRTKIDELPQLWNVLRGEMSLVGPRPVVPALTFEFREPYEKLLRVRPGLTDPAALKYFRETDLLKLSENPLEFFKQVVTPEKLRISLAYQEHATLRSDLKVILQTAASILRGTKRMDLPRPEGKLVLPVPPIRYYCSARLRAAMPGTTFAADALPLMPLLQNPSSARQNFSESNSVH